MQSPHIVTSKFKHCLQLISSTLHSRHNLFLSTYPVAQDVQLAYSLQDKDAKHVFVVELYL